MKVNESKTKIMIFRKGERMEIEKWKYKNKEVEVVGENKYLGFWFMTENLYILGKWRRK